MYCPPPPPPHAHSAKEKEQGLVSSESGWCVRVERQLYPRTVVSVR